MRITKLIIITLLPIIAYSQNTSIKSLPAVNTKKLIDFSDSLFLKGISEKLYPGGQLVIVKGDSLLLNKGYGVSDIGKEVKATTDFSLFQVGSVGKIFTSIAALQLVEKGKLDLNKDVNEYLTGWKISNPYKTPVTLHYLLTHSAGFNERVIGYISRTGKDVESLEKHLKERMPTLFQEPGTEINYSNYGYALIGLLIEKQSGLKFEDYIKKNILVPLKMEHTTYLLPGDYESRNEYAKGYKNDKNIFSEVKSYPRSATPAGSIITTSADMSMFLKMLLGKSDLLNKESLNTLYKVQFTNSPVLTGYSYGFEEQKYNGNTFFAKGGDISGFNAHVLVFPQWDLAIYMVVNTQTDDFMTGFNEELKKSLFLPARDKYKRIQETDLQKYTGEYRNSRYNHETVEDMPALLKNGAVKIFLSDSADIEAFINNEYRYFMALGDGAFWDKEDPNQIIKFEKRSGRMNLYYSFSDHGMDVPVSFTKIPWCETPSFIDSGYPSIWLPIMIYILIPVWLLLVWVIRKRRPVFLKGKLLPVSNHIPLLLFSFLAITDFLVFFMPFIKHSGDLLFGLPKQTTNWKYLHWVLIVLLIPLFVFTFKMWKQKKGSLVSRIYYLLFTVSAVHYVYFLFRWHFISMAN